MLPKRYRLRRNAEIRRVRRDGRRWRHPLLFLFTATNNQETSRFAISASRRVGKAVVRNKARRRVREAIRQYLPRIKPGYDCLFVVRDSLPAASFADIHCAVGKLLQQAHLLD